MNVWKILGGCQEEIDYLEDKLSLVQSELNDFSSGINPKLDTILKHITRRIN
ncbi:hypothetical protein VKI21_00640 [Cyanobacterium aponinum UTEX 3222]|uniref:Uncharacterized protein n=1 Tax=Cyanobacterium aponinum AL20115 TaxID=3090662 RepID=A0AAF0ZF04_9CHRO|nr:hypothetical protein [Cyanobacterium aponinum]WPF87647.1 hypothetical protein SAY89_12670 [Cyanobacterium aponinum AL20115]WRL42225.1 hypothetical protein VKI21_00640 [Cyanobacterium aponinum UTEX 3222]